MTDSDNKGRLRRLMNEADRERRDVEGFWTSSAGGITAVAVIAVIIVVGVLGLFL